jgi:general secretion pathway protein C
MAAALSVVYWGLHWQISADTETQGSSGTAGTAGGAFIDSTAVARALGAANPSGAEPANPAGTSADATRFALLGVLGQKRAGTALIAVDGKPAKPVRLGAPVADGWTLLRLESRRAVLGQGGTEIELTLPPLAQAARLDKKAP